MSNKTNTKTRGSAKDERLEARILEWFGRDPTPLDGPKIARRLSLRKVDHSALDRALARLETTGRLARIRHDQYTLPIEADLVPGRILVSRSGAGTLMPDDPTLPRLDIPAEATGTAFHQDRVLVRREVRAEHPKAVAEGQGKVIRILERARTQIAGILQKTKQFFYVVPDDPRIPHDIYVTLSKNLLRAPRVDEKVVVELVEWVSRHNTPEGRVVEVLGRADKPGVDVESILRLYNLPAAFPDAALRECERWGDSIRDTDLKGRRDCRSHLVITIDPDDAKDFDDAFCLQKRTGGGWKLWIHIADVAHYVRPGSPLDAEARIRGNSTYLVDRVIPMLPESLSNQLCSLRPEVDRLTRCVECDLDSEGRVIGTEFYPAVIHSRRRFSYQEALDVLEKKRGDDPICKMLLQADQLAQRLRRHRFKQGALNLDVPETKLRLDSRGRIQRIEIVANDRSHQLIEEFMLLANEAVAKQLKKLSRMGVYRIHEPPAPERLEELREEMALFNLSVGNLSKRGALARLLDRLNLHPAERVLKISVLRSMKRARYATVALGHFGLAKSDYTHFTSPIRRYADLLVHRALAEGSRMDRETLVETVDHISFTERNSADAEQDSKRVKLLDHLDRQIRSDSKTRYEAVVSEIRNFGFFTEVPALGLSGMVRLSTLDDFYRFDSRKNCLLGRRSRRSIAVGDRVEVEVLSVDPFKKQVNFSLLAEKGGRQVGRPSGDGRGRPGRSARGGRRRERSKEDGGDKDRNVSRAHQRDHSRRKERNRRRQ